MSSSAGRPSVPSPVPSTVADPGLDDVLESLYRDSGGGRRALPRFEPALRPPEDADGYAWLYRPEPAERPASLTTPAAETVVQPPTPGTGSPRSRGIVPRLLAGALVRVRFLSGLLARLL